MDFITQPKLRSSKEIRDEARAQLSGRWKPSILLNLVPAVITIVLALALGLVLINLDFNEPSSFEGGWIADLQTIWGFAAPFVQVGISFTFLNMLRRPDYNVSPLKDALQVFSRKYFVGILILQLLTTVFTFLWALLFIIPGIVKSYSYSQAPLIYKDLRDEPHEEFPSANDCISESMSLMDGQKANLLFLHLSFIGWHILCLFTLGIGYLWLIPYMQMADVVFYENISEGAFLSEADEDKPYSKKSLENEVEEVDHDPTDPDDFSDLEDPTDDDFDDF